MNTRIITTIIAVFSLVFALPASASSFGIPEVIGEQVVFGTPEGPIEGPVQVEPVQNLEQSAATAESITVGWSSSYFSITPVEETYRVVLMNNKTNEVVLDQTVNSRLVTIDSLDPNTPYTFSVATIRGDSSSEPVLTTVRTAPVAPSAVSSTVERKQVLRDVITNKPINGFADAAGGRMVAKVSWKASKGKIRGYDVLVYHKGASEPFKIVQTTKTHVSISGLKEGKSYQYQVRARFNDHYTSQASKKKLLKIKRFVAKKKLGSTTHSTTKKRHNQQPARLNLQ